MAKLRRCKRDYVGEGLKKGCSNCSTGKAATALRRCKGKYGNEEFEMGYFHCWGVNYEEFCDVGVGNYTVAIVELPDGRVVMPPAEDIIFIDSL